MLPSIFHFERLCTHSVLSPPSGPQWKWCLLSKIQSATECNSLLCCLHKVSSG